LNQKQKYILSLAIILILAGLSIFGLFSRGLGLGLDLKGGLNIVLTAKDGPKTPVNQKTMDQALFIMRNRIDKLGVSEPSIEQHGKRNIILQLPGIRDANKAIKIIGQTALLEFKIVEAKYNSKDTFQMNQALAKKEKVLGPTLMTGEGLSSASAGYDTENPAATSYVVKLDFTSDGADKFADVTSKNINKRLAVVLDGQVMTAPTIKSAITDGSGVIEGISTLEEAKKVALVLQTGQLPFKLGISQQQEVGPTLGKDSLNAAFIAGLVGFALVALFMLAFYRVFGLITWISLAIFTSLLLGSMVLLDYFLQSVGAAGISLSLPSIAGIILMIGVAADSSIIVFERIKEEVREGKGFRSSLDVGFTHGFKTFLDADLVTFITATVLFWLGIGPVRGFALTLMLGIFVDLTVSLLFTRSILKLIAANNWIKNPSLIGLKLKEDAEVV